MNISDYGRSFGWFAHCPRCGVRDCLLYRFYRGGMHGPCAHAYRPMIWRRCPSTACPEHECPMDAVPVPHASRRLAQSPIPEYKRGRKLQDQRALLTRALVPGPDARLASLGTHPAKDNGPSPRDSLERVAADRRPQSAR